MFDYEVLWWHWAVFGVALMVFELIVPGAFMLWIGLAAVMVSAILALFPSMGFETQLILFSILAVITTYVGKKLLVKRDDERGEMTLNRRGQTYIGRTFILQEPITQGTGYLNIDDTRWKVQGEDVPAGTSVTVTAIENNTLLVKVG